MSSEESEELKLIILGDSCCGKTALAERYVNGTFSTEIQSTVATSLYLKQVQISFNKTLSLYIWDTAGMERFNALPRSHYRDAQCCILVFDVTYEKSFNSLTRWKKELDEKLGLKDLDDFPVILVGTKCDLRS